MRLLFLCIPTLLIITFCVGHAQDRVIQDYSDAVSPAQQSADHEVAKIPFWRWSSQIRQTKENLQDIEKQLEQLPPLQANLQLNGYGYHSDHLPISSNVPNEPKWQLDIKRRYRLPNLSIALIPAVDHRTGTKQRGYGFPRRFSIEAIEKDQIVKTVVDWRHQDFPDPGRLPVIFKIPNTRTDSFRLNVYRGASVQGLEYFALSEIIMIVDDEFATTQQITPSSSYTSPPYWDVSYLNDWRLGLGLPVFEESPRGSDLVFQSEHLRNNHLRFRLDLGSVCHIPWTSLFPARSPGDISVPGFGFPRKIEIRTSSELLEDKLYRPLRYYTSTPTDPGNDWLRIRSNSAAQDARWVEFTFSDFPSYNGIPTFALGEISIDHKDTNHALGRPIQLIDSRGLLDRQLEFLVDNQVSGRTLSDRVIWLQGLAARKPLIEKQKSLVSRLDFQQQRYSKMVRIALASLVSVLLLAAILSVVLTTQRRRQENLRLRKQITRDLHDDLGSKMAAISLTSELIRSQTSNPEIIEGSEMIFSTAGEMNTSLRDVLWFTDTDTDQLDQLVRRLAQVAEQMVENSRLTLSISEIHNLPRRAVHLNKKREIIYFLREALNNAVKHSKAENIQVSINWTDKRLSVAISDNGQGFSQPDPNEQDFHLHYGINTMKQRAKNLNGIYQCQSELGHGTQISLDIPL